MELLADENVSSRFVAALRAEGHSVERVEDVLGQGKPDDDVLEYCRQESVVLLTNDQQDFSGLDPDDHAGILILTTQACSPRAVVRAVGRIETVVPEDSLRDLILYVPEGWT